MNGCTRPTVYRQPPPPPHPRGNYTGAVKLARSPVKLAIDYSPSPRLSKKKLSLSPRPLSLTLSPRELNSGLCDDYTFRNGPHELLAAGGTPAPSSLLLSLLLLIVCDVCVRFVCLLHNSCGSRRSGVEGFVAISGGKWWWQW